MSYSPDPLHTQHVRLTPELNDLREILAEHVHDLWARQRLAAGWVYGAQRDDQAKSHPCLVPYDQLPESEKEYDRATAVETLRAVLAHGYRIIPPTKAVEPVRKSSQVEGELAALRSALLAPQRSDARALLKQWRATGSELRWTDLELCYRFIGCLLEFQEPLVAYDCASEGLRRWPDDLRLMQLQGMSLARSGAALQANQLFRRLRDAGHADEETLGNLARTYKTLWSEGQDPDARREYLKAAYDAYLASYERTGGFWSGINVAFLALMRGDTDVAHQVATRVHEECSQVLDADRLAGRDLYWVTAALGEASLICGRRREAMQWYRRATMIAGRRYGNVASTCRQARTLVRQLGFDWSEFVECFPLPEVIVLPLVPSDAGAASSVSEMRLEAAFARAVRDALRSDRPAWGFGCLRAWWDVVFLETVLDAGGNITVLLEDETTPLHDRFGRELVHRAERLLEQSAAVHHVTVRAGTTGAKENDYTDRILIGLGAMQARQLDSRPAILTPRSATDGCVFRESIHRVARGGACDIRVLEGDLAADVLRACGASGTPGSDSDALPLRSVADGAEHLSRVMALLFADVRGFSRLDESQLITFTREFLGAVFELILASTGRPFTRHTWGDGLFFTFERIVDAGCFALDLAGLIAEMDWEHKGLPHDLSIRIGLHAGPVHEYFDPVSEQATFCGVHVNHAARIEPITPAGQVYASEAFAALASQEGIERFVCEYVGRAPLAKDFGVWSMYHVRRAPRHDMHQQEL